MVIAGSLVARSPRALDPSANNRNLPQLALAARSGAPSWSTSVSTRRTKTSEANLSPLPTKTMATPAGTVVVATDGKSSGDGTVERPLDLRTALSAKSPVKPGGTVLLRAGTYRRTYTSRVNGTQADPITVRSFPGEWAVLDGTGAAATMLTIDGADTWFRDFEITNSDTKRRSTTPGGATDLSRGTSNGVDVFGLRTKLIGLAVHDAGNGIVLTQSAIDSEVNGNLIFDNGWAGPDRGHGHGIYVQNREGHKSIKNNIIFNNFGFGIHAYGKNAHVQDISMIGNVSFGNGSPAVEADPNLFIGTSKNPAQNIEVRQNVLYHSPTSYGANLSLGYGADANQNVQIDSNVIVGGSPVVHLERSWEALSVTANVVSFPNALDDPRLLVDLETAPPPRGLLGLGPSPYTWNDNTYYSPRASEHPAVFRLPADDENPKGRTMSFERWRDETGFDSNATFLDQSKRQIRVVSQTNTYGGAGVIAVIGSSESSVSVDLKDSGVQNGQRFEIVDAQAPFGDAIARGVYDGRSVRITLTGDAVQQPIGGGAKRLSHTPRDFGVFLVRRGGA